MNAALTIAFAVLLVVTTFTLVEELRRNERDRAAWTLFALGLGFWIVGAICRFIFFQDANDRTMPAWLDPLFLAFYPLVFAALVLVITTRLRRFNTLPWLDGLAGVLVVIALSLTFIHEPVSDHTGYDGLQTAVLLSYPLGDLILIVLTGFLLRTTGFDRSGPWPLVAAGLVVFAVADLLFVVLDPGKVELESPLWLLWMAGVILIVLGARKPERDVREIMPDHSQLLPPLAFTLAAIGVLLVGQERDLLPAAIGFAVATLLVLLVRMILGARENAKMFEERESRLTDELTGLPAPPQVKHWLHQIPSNDGDEPGHMVLVINLNRFRELNAALGPDAGDILLNAVATRLSRSIGRRGRLGRIGGDEFILLVEGDCDAALAADLAAETERALKDPFSVYELEVHIDASTGVSTSNGRRERGDELMRRAQLAMREAKASDESLVVYSEAAQDSAREQLQLLTEFRSGLERGELVLHYQPKVTLADQSVVSAEALVRWQHPQQGLLGPFRFLDLAESAGLMHAVTSQVISIAIEQIAQWRESGISLHVAVNLAMPNLLDTALPQRVAAELAEHGVDPGQLTMEITEKIVMSDPDRVMGNLLALSEIGFPISLDDFGSENTSLAYLRQLPLDEVKLDRSLAGDMTASPEDAAIVRASVALAHDLRLHVVAEGVEDQDTVDALREAGCNEIQGYVFAKPMPADEVPGWLNDFAAQHA